MYSDVLTCLTRDPLAGNVSPALIGTQGTIPLSIVSTIPDIMQHYRDCSASSVPRRPRRIEADEAENPIGSCPCREGGLSRHKCVFLLSIRTENGADDLSDAQITGSTLSPLSITSQNLQADLARRRPSDSVNTVAGGLKELDKRIGERKGQKVVVKVMWDRGAIQQLWQCVPSTPLLPGLNVDEIALAAITSRSRRKRGHRSASLTPTKSPTSRSRSSTSTALFSVLFTRKRW